MTSKLSNDEALHGSAATLYAAFVEFQVAVRSWGDMFDRSTKAVMAGTPSARELLDLERDAWERHADAADRLHEATQRYRSAMGDEATQA